MYLEIIGNEIKREILVTWSYRFQWFGEFLSLVIFFIFLLNLSKEKHIAGVSYCLWFYSILIIGDVSGKISQERILGTFEHIYLSIVPVPFLFFAKIISAIIRSIVIMGALFIFLWSLGYIKISVTSILNLIFINILITPGLFGLSLILGGLTILLKDVGWLLNIINNTLLFLSGIFLPIESFPLWLQDLSKIILINRGIEIIKNEIILSNLLLLLTYSVFYLILGLIIFYYCEKKAKILGTLGHY